MKRNVYHVVLKCQRARRSSWCYYNKFIAIARAKLQANRPGSLGQVVVHRRDGKVQTEWTYGNDPRRTRG